MHTTDRTWAEIRLDHLTHNYNELRRHLASDCQFLAPVKANAYGHGAVAVSRHLESLGCDYLAVACLSEALELREAGITLPILVFGYTNPTDAPILVEQRLTQAIFSLEQAQALSRALAGTKQTLGIHIELDTGMGRLGFPVSTTAHGLEDARIAMTLPHLDIQGIYTHFSASDAEEEDDYSKEQLERFAPAARWLETETGRQIPLRHAANSGGVLRLPKSHLNMIRPGLSLYGVSPNPRIIEADLRPIMTLQTRIVQVRPFADGESVSYSRTYMTKGAQTVAVVPIGYADGLHRALSGKMEMFVQGQRVPQVGRICMDMCMLDVTRLKKISVGDVVTVFGGAEDEIPSVYEQAQLAGTIPYEMLTSVSPRVARVYSHGAE